MAGGVQGRSDGWAFSGVDSAGHLVERTSPLRREVKLKKAVIIIVLFLLGLITYSNSFNNGFVVDDFGRLTLDSGIRNPKAILLNFHPAHLTQFPNHYYRPLLH